MYFGANNPTPNKTSKIIPSIIAPIDPDFNKDMLLVYFNGWFVPFNSKVWMSFYGR